MFTKSRNQLYAYCIFCAILPALYGCGVRFDAARSTIILARADSLYHEGYYQDAAQAYKNAAALNSPEGQYLLGRMYAKGEGVPPSREQAVHWIMKSAEQEYPHADVDMGLRFLFGDGVPLNRERALFHFHRAADNEYVLAMYYMGIMNASGWGTPASAPEALRWFRTANAYGYPVEKQLLTDDGVSAYMAAATGRAADTLPDAGVTLLDISVRRDAAAIQSRLAELGFYRMKVDGLWGPGSREALRKFQKSRRLDADGAWNMSTQTQLFRD